jgi:hypothetical protein
MSAAKTKAQQAKKDTKPRQEFNNISQLGLKAQALAVEHQSKLGDRLGPSFLIDFSKDLNQLNLAVPAVLTITDGKVQLTAAQLAALEGGYKLVKGIRTTVKSFHPDKDVLLAYGVGTPTNKAIVKEVVSAIQKIVDRIDAEPAEAKAFDIVADDEAALKAAIVAINAADQAQEKGRAEAPQTTRQRNITARRILAGVKKIAGAGMRTFTDDKTVYANFESLVSKAA